MSCEEGSPSPRPYVDANNYAFCGAGPSEILGQVKNFAAPSKPQLSLYCLWLGMNFGSADGESTWSQGIQSSILINSNAVNRLYAKGARTILIEGQFGDTPGDVRSFGTNTALLSRFHQTEARLNAGFLDAMDTFSQTRPDLRLLFVDMFSKFDDVLANPPTYGFTKATIEVIGDFGDPEISDKSFTGPGADYVFWNDQHGTRVPTRLRASQTSPYAPLPIRRINSWSGTRGGASASPGVSGEKEPVSSVFPFALGLDGLSP